MKHSRSASIPPRSYQHLSWKSNTENICKKKLWRNLCYPSSQTYVNEETFISVFQALVRPYFDYCCEVRDVFGETQSRLQKLQNRAARIILNMTNDVYHTISLRALGWEPLKFERKKAEGKMMYKTLNNMGPQSLTKLFSNKSDKTEYHL